MWKQNNALLHDNFIKEEIMKEIKDFLKFNKNEGTSQQNLWDTRKSMGRGKHVALSASKRNYRALTLAA